jgi:hypothetical protein
MGKRYLVVRGTEILKSTNDLGAARAFQNGLGWRGVKVLRARLVFDRPRTTEK